MSRTTKQSLNHFLPGIGRITKPPCAVVWLKPSRQASTDVCVIGSMHGGFSLFEMLIALAIVGVLTAMALPAYQDNLLRSGRAEAQTELMIVAAEQERFFSSNHRYSTDATPLVSETPVNETTRTTANGRYRITVSAGASGDIATSFVATAIPQAAQSADSCTTLTLSSSGVRNATGDAVERCWQH